ncbi:MAG: hypothetical protein ACJA2J_001630 [Candidatus Azotimanducaceae bacterium]|jgi:hypothetical protein
MTLAVRLSMYSACFGALWACDLAPLSVDDCVRKVCDCPLTWFRLATYTHLLGVLPSIKDLLL